MTQQSGFGAFTDGLLAGRLITDALDKTRKEALSLAHLTAEERAEFRRNQAETVARVLAEDKKLAREQKAKLNAQRAAELAEKWETDPNFRRWVAVFVTVGLVAFYPAGLVVAAIFLFQFALLLGAACTSDSAFEHRKAAIRSCARRIFSSGFARRTAVGQSHS